MSASAPADVAVVSADTMAGTMTHTLAHTVAAHAVVG